MPRRAWTVVIVVVAVIVAAGAGTALVAATHHRSEAVWPAAVLSAQSGQSGQGWQGDGQGMNGGYGMNGQNGGYRSDGNGMGRRFGERMMDRGIWQPLRGIPWLVLGLFLGAGVTILVWQPWKRQALAAGAASPAGAQGTAVQWAQWHRDLHEADEAATQPLATAPAAGPEPPEVTAEMAAGAETPAEPGSEA
jgi:hypothetical protein